MKNLLLNFVCLFCLIQTGFTQYHIEEDDETGDYHFFNGDVRTDYKVTFDEETELVKVINDKGKETLFYLYEEYSEIHWLDKVFTNSEAPYSIQDLYWNHELSTFQDNGKYGLINPFNQTIILEALVDSLAYNNDYSAELILYKEGKVLKLPFDHVFAPDFTKSMRFYDGMVPCYERFDYLWDDEGGYLTTENGKFGLLSYRSEYSDSLNERLFYSTVLLKPVVDTFYVLEDEYIVADKGGLLALIEPYNMGTPPDFLYSAIYFDEDAYELVFIPSIEGLQQKYPSLIDAELMSAKMGLMRFTSKIGQGVFSQRTNELVLPMNYDSVSIKGDYIEVKKDVRYGYMLPQYYDYAFTGYEGPYFLFDKALTIDALNEGDSLWVTHKGDSIRLFIQYDKLRLNAFRGTQVVSDTLAGVSKVEDQLDLLYSINKVYRLNEKIQSLIDIRGIQYQFYQGHYFIWIKGESQEEIDDLKEKGDIASFADIARIELITKEDNNYPSSFDNGLGASWYYSNYQSSRLFFSNKEIEADGIVIFEKGRIVVYNGTKGIVYNWAGERLNKLKKHEFLLDFGNGYQLVEKWNGKDTTATCLVKNNKGKTIFQRDRMFDDNEYSSSQDAYLKMLRNDAFVGNYSSNEIPMELITTAHQTFIKLNNWFYEEGEYRGWKPKFFSLDGEKLDADYILEEDQDGRPYGFEVLVKVTPRALLYGIHDGHKWIVPIIYDHLQEHGLFSYNYKYGNEPLVDCFEVGIKNVYNMLDLEGEPLLPNNYYWISEGEVIDNIWQASAISEGETEKQQVRIDLKDLQNDK